MPVIALAQGKGGAGKSTVAVNLAVGLEAALVDADSPQFTAASWAAIRAKVPPLVVTADSTRGLVELVHKLSKQHTFTVIDAPARLLEMSRAILMLADVVLVPAAPTMPDVWAVQDTLNVIREAKRERRGLKAALLFNRFRPHVKSNVALQAAASELAIAPLKTTLGQRVAYADAFAEGRSVLEWHDVNAKAEMRALVAEVKKLAK